MANLGEYLGAGSGTTKLLLHLNGNSTDSSGNNNNGTDTGITVIDNGKFGKCYKYIDSTDFTDFGTMASLWNGTNDKATFSLWFKADDISAVTNFVLAKFSNQAAERFQGFYISVLTDGKVRCFIGGTDENTNYDYWTTNTGIVTGDNTWYHIVITLDLSANTCVIYVNGSIVANTLSSVGSNITVFASNAITFKAGRLRNLDGSYNGMENGYLDEVIIENRAWSAEEVKKRYTDSLGRFATI